MTTAFTNRRMRISVIHDDDDDDEEQSLPWQSKQSKRVSFSEMIVSKMNTIPDPRPIHHTRFLPV